MTRRLALAALAALLAVAVAPTALAQSAGKPFGVKSGIVETTTDFMGTQKSTLYFDDFGVRQATVMVTEMAMMGQVHRSTTVTVTAGGYRIEYEVEKKKGKRFKAGVPASTVVDAAGLSAKMKEQYKFKELEAKEFLGKRCVGYFMEPMKGMPVTMYAWNGIPLYSETSMGGPKPIVMKAVSLKVDVPVPADRFVVPADVQLEDY